MIGVIVSLLVGSNIVDVLIPNTAPNFQLLPAASAPSVISKPAAAFPVIPAIPAAAPAAVAAAVPAAAHAPVMAAAPPVSAIHVAPAAPPHDDQDMKSRQAVATWLHQNSNPNTSKTYASAWYMFEAFCIEKKLQAFPTTPVTVALWITSLTDGGYSAATISTYLAGVTHVHVINSLPNPCADPVVAKIKRVSSAIAPPPKGRAAFSSDELSAIATFLESDDVRMRWEYVRDGCLLFLSVLGLLRGSELVSLKWKDVRFEWVPDHVKKPTHVPAALIINVVRSKTDPAGVGAIVPIQADWESNWCAVRWMTKWQETLQAFGKAVRGDAWVFPNMTKDSSSKSITRATVSKRFKRLAEAIDVKSDNIGSHSGRKSGATQMVLSGVTLLELKQHGRWKSNAVERYFVPGLFERLRATAKVFDDSEADA